MTMASPDLLSWSAIVAALSVVLLHGPDWVVFACLGFALAITRLGGGSGRETRAQRSAAKPSTRPAPVAAPAAGGAAKPSSRPVAAPVTAPAPALVNGCTLCSSVGCAGCVFSPFEAAVWFVAHGAAASAGRFRPSQAQQLQLYGLYKAATAGRCDREKPGVFSVEAGKKWQAWKTHEAEPEPRQAYAARLTSILPDWHALARNGACPHPVVYQHELQPELEQEAEAEEGGGGEFETLRPRAASFAVCAEADALADAEGVQDEQSVRRSTDAAAVFLK